MKNFLFQFDGLERVYSAPNATLALKQWAEDKKQTSVGGVYIKEIKTDWGVEWWKFSDDIKTILYNVSIEYLRKCPISISEDRELIIHIKIKGISIYIPEHEYSMYSIGVFEPAIDYLLNNLDKAIVI